MNKYKLKYYSLFLVLFLVLLLFLVCTPPIRINVALPIFRFFTFTNINRRKVYRCQAIAEPAGGRCSRSTFVPFRHEVKNKAAIASVCTDLVPPHSWAVPSLFRLDAFRESHSTRQRKVAFVRRGVCFAPRAGWREGKAGLSLQA